MNVVSTYHTTGWPPLFPAVYFNYLNYLRYFKYLKHFKYPNYLVVRISGGAHVLQQKDDAQGAQPSWYARRI